MQLKKLINEIVEWIHYNPNVKASCVSSDAVTVLNSESNQRELWTKMLMEISGRDLHNDIIKPYENGG